jgi:hypothetical protein
MFLTSLYYSDYNYNDIIIIEMREKFDNGEDPLDHEQQQGHGHGGFPFGFNPFGGGGQGFTFKFNFG